MTGSRIRMMRSTCLSLPFSDGSQSVIAMPSLPRPTKTALQIARDPYPAPAYRIIYLGRGMDADKLYLPHEVLQADPLRALRAEHVAFLVLKRYNDEAPAMLPLTAALAREGRRLAVFSPYRADAATRPEPFLHNTDARITSALERSGPVVEIWILNAPGS